MTTVTYTYDFSGTPASSVTVTYDDASTPTTNPPNGFAVTSISGTWQGNTIYFEPGLSYGNYTQDVGGLGYYDNTIFPNFGANGDGANAPPGNLDGIDTAGIVFKLNDANGNLVQLFWDGTSAASYSYTLADGFTTLGGGTAALSGFTACYAAGTRILTARGEVPVEALKAGDRVVTLNSFGLAAVRWIGHRRVEISRHPRKRVVAPIRVRAHAFAPGRPHRDLLLSPDHALFVDGVLIPVRYLLNGATIAQEMVETVTYYHVELDRHDVLLAEGMPAESYLDTGNRAAFANGGAAVQAHPQFAPAEQALAVWQERSCAPLALGGPIVEQVRARLLARAAELGHVRVTDPALRVTIDGVIAAPFRAGRDVDEWVVEVPPGAHVVRLVSRGMVPAWTLPGSSDHRCLGIAVQDIRIDGAPLPATAFAGGWHRAEPGLRWTDGDARLEVGGGRLAMRLLPLLSYWDERPVTEARQAA